MISVDEAYKIILQTAKDFGETVIPAVEAYGKVLSAPLRADRDLPPFNRVTMDGIALRYSDLEQGISAFKIKGIQAAGDTPIESGEGECIEIMTGCALPASTDTVIRYEDIEVSEGFARI